MTKLWSAVLLLTNFKAIFLFISSVHCTIVFTKKETSPADQIWNKRFSRQPERRQYPLIGAYKSALTADQSVYIGGLFYLFSSARGRGPLCIYNVWLVIVLYSFKLLNLYVHLTLTNTIKSTSAIQGLYLSYVNKYWSANFRSTFDMYTYVW